MANTGGAVHQEDDICRLHIIAPPYKHHEERTYEITVELLSEEQTEEKDCFTLSFSSLKGRQEDSGRDEPGPHLHSLLKNNMYYTSNNHNNSAK